MAAGAAPLQIKREEDLEKKLPVHRKYKMSERDELLCFCMAYHIYESSIGRVMWFGPSGGDSDQNRHELILHFVCAD
jgi:hypothetical protein